MTFYNRIESVRGIAIDLTNGRKWRGASDKAAVFDALDAARREYMRLSDENAKLRELCGRALAVIENNCGVCAYFYDCDIMNDCKCVAPKKIRDELRELGIEVSK